MQFGFTPGLSTTQAVESVADTILQGFENKEIVNAPLIDLSKAFDTISHKLIIDKLSHYGIQGIELRLMTSYLENRQQMAVIGNEASEFETVLTGIPQGSILGPFLF